ncbi:MAG: FtsW/RodA/SpoVE family cell cycle protein [Clostridia bacterium]|nr:FtsW/RodA/SpoVE family cell cycle protein [Clostridia bacterium]
MKIYSLKNPVFLLVLINIIAFWMLYRYVNPDDYIIIYTGAILLALSVITYATIYYGRMGDTYLFLIVYLLVTLGVVMICRINYDKGMKQVLWYLISLVAFYVTFFCYRYIKFLSNLKWLYYFVGVFLFVFTLAFGTTINGAKNWITIGRFNIQPSEIIKLFFVFFLACYYSFKEKKMFDRIKERYVVMFCTYTYLGFLILQREWGIMLLFFITYIVMEFVFEGDFKILLGNILLACLGCYMGYLVLNHIQIRFHTWLNPWENVTGSGYQISQSLFAIASGGFFGTGLGQGRPGYIPEVHSDFIFSAICEELGLFGGFAIIILFFIFTYRGIKIALKLPDGFDKCVATGITVMFGIQTFIIIGGVIKMIPLTGITLPFISYGGSSLLSSFISLGILQAISAKESK